MNSTSLQKRENPYDEEKVNGTRASTKKNKLLVIGGPAEGRLIEETPYGVMYYAEITPVIFRKYSVDILDDPDYLSKGYTEHIYYAQTLMYKEESGRIWTKRIYLHSSLDLDAGLLRLKEFLMKQFIMMELT